MRLIRRRLALSIGGLLLGLAAGCREEADPVRATLIGGLDGLLPSASAYKFDVRLVPDGKRWKVAWAAWEAVRRFHSSVILRSGATKDLRRAEILREACLS